LSLPLLQAKILEVRLLDYDIHQFKPMITFSYKKFKVITPPPEKVTNPMDGIMIWSKPHKLEFRY